MLRVLPVLLVLAAWLYALIDCILTPETEVRNLPKALWVVVIVLTNLVGAVCWLIFGRPARRLRPGGAAGRPGGGPRPGRTPSGPPPRPVGPDDDPDFLRQLRRSEERRKRDADRRDADRRDADRRDADRRDGEADGQRESGQPGSTDPDNPDGGPE